MHVGIVAQRDNERAASLAADVGAALDATVSFDTETAGALGVDGVAPTAMTDCDLVVSIGGDGTFLYTARSVGATPVMGVNLGEVGFLNATAPDDAVGAVVETATAIREGTAAYREMAQVAAAGEGVDLPPALNEVAVLGPQRGHGNGLDVEVFVDGDTYSAGRADGVIVATPTGSSAYNLSEGGPLVHPDADALVLTEMCADGAMPPLVVDPDAGIRVRADGPDRVHVVADGRTSETVDPPAEFRLGRADRPVRVAGPDLDFVAALAKLE
ncbi:NAD(+)/NADH kinase [Halosegnis marinus]|uniref:NAD kinase n=1 Tax=Halosegnis marinus TaxID=3034023 RepID=A0ABD5ZLH3_9EURY|nr:NAD(+)/NADH kinase [Halosegnis sp. DT85]